MKELRSINTSIFIAFMIFANAGVAGEPQHAAGAKDVTLGPGERLEFPSGSLVYGNWRILGGGTAERLEAETSEGAWTTVVERAYPQGNWQDETTFSIASPKPGSPSRNSGLLGPVRLIWR